MRWYHRDEIERLRSHGRVVSKRDRNDEWRDVLTITLPEPGGAIVRENVRALENATLSDWASDPNNPYLREWFSSRL
jgi:hypothetical protein